MACSCNSKTGYVVTTGTGDKVSTRTEYEAKSLAQKTGGTYRAG